VLFLHKLGISNKTFYKGNPSVWKLNCTKNWPLDALY